MLTKTIMILSIFMSLNGICSDKDHIDQHIKCEPIEHYSGGYDIYEIIIVGDSVNNSRYTGMRYFQRTSGHGIRQGGPELKETILLTSTIQTETLKLEGFKNSFGVSDSIQFPLTWDGQSILIRRLLCCYSAFLKASCLALPL
jgi:hypothetical protein